MSLTCARISTGQCNGHNEPRIGENGIRLWLIEKKKNDEFTWETEPEILKSNPPSRVFCQVCGMSFEKWVSELKNAKRTIDPVIAKSTIDPEIAKTIDPMIAKSTIDPEIGHFSPIQEVPFELSQSSDLLVEFQDGVFCEYKSTDGHLFLLEKSMIWKSIKSINILYSDIAFIKMGLFKNQRRTEKTWDMLIKIRPTSEKQVAGQRATEYLFQSLDSSEKDPIINFLKSKTVKVKEKMWRVVKPRYTFPGFFEDIVPRLLDMKYGPDIAPLINVCVKARICPMKRNGYFDWERDITYRAWIDAKVKSCEDPEFKNVLRADNWLHRHMAASYALGNKKKYRFFLGHRVPPLRCVQHLILSEEGEEGDGAPEENWKLDFSDLLSCKCGFVKCRDCLNGPFEDDNISLNDCHRCDGYFCGGDECSHDCVCSGCGIVHEDEVGSE
jgi:hypothetical protein